MLSLRSIGPVVMSVSVCVFVCPRSSSELHVLTSDLQIFLILFDQVLLWARGDTYFQLHFVRLDTAQLKDEEIARDNQVLACNFDKCSPILIFFDWQTQQ